MNKNQSCASVVKGVEQNKWANVAYPTKYEEIMKKLIQDKNT